MAKRKPIPIGTRFGKLIVIERASNQGKRNYTAYRCECECGDTIITLAYKLRGGQKSCRRCASRKLIPISTRFGGQVVIERVENSREGHTMYRCKCDCGNEHIVGAAVLRIGKSQRCPGCGRMEGANKSRKPIELGTKFGNLTVIARAENIGGYTAYRCRCNCGNEVVYPATYIRCGDRVTCGCGRSQRKLIPIGTRFGKLTVIERAPDIGKARNTAYRCKCDCGKAFVAKATFLRRDRYQACPECVLPPEGKVGFNTLFGSYKSSARKRGLAFELTKDEFRKLVTNNCTYCGIPPSTIFKAHPERGNFTYNGIDRMNNDLGYIPDNATTCCKRCNYMKGDRSYDEWVAWLDRVVEFRTRRKKNDT